jgi:hypothetical protein
VQSTNIEANFNNCLATTATHYKTHLLASDCSLERKGPMSRDQAESFFVQYGKNTHPLYILETSEGFYAYY